jgi:hypothetical protein
LAVVRPSFAFPTEHHRSNYLTVERSFAAHAPIILAILLIAVLQCPRTSRTSSRQEELRQLDVLGFCSMATTIGSLVLLLQILQQSGLEVVFWVIALFAVFSFSSVSLVLTEIFYAKDPLIPICAMKGNGSGVLCLLQFTIMFAQFAVSLTSQ